MSEWQPIETAPLEAVVLVWHPRLGVCFALAGTEDGKPGENWGWYQTDRSEDGGFGLMDEDPTHWMPLPKPPAA